MHIFIIRKLMFNIYYVDLLQVFAVIKESFLGLACVVVAHVVLSNCVPVLVATQFSVFVVDLEGGLYLLD